MIRMPAAISYRAVTLIDIRSFKEEETLPSKLKPSRSIQIANKREQVNAPKRGSPYANLEKRSNGQSVQGISPLYSHYCGINKHDRLSPKTSFCLI